MKSLKRAFLRLSVAIGAFLITAGAAFAQGVPVIDNAVLTQATQTAGNTSQIMNSNQQILQTVNKTLAALTGNRATGDLSQAALGSGFNLGGAPSFSALLQGGMSWGNLGQYGTQATTILNALNLVKSLSGNIGNPTGQDKAYSAAVNTAAALTAMISGSQASAASRTQSFQAAAQQIGTAIDVKGSVDQNSQLQVQTGLTINELIGVLNANNAAINAQQAQDLAAQAAQARVNNFTPYNGGAQ
ncbi:type IV secretion system protein [Labrys miyagiensis]|nr:type IV secretion system protein [Labrys miyagiensis]